MGTFAVFGPKVDARPRRDPTGVLLWLKSLPTNLLLRCLSRRVSSDVNLLFDITIRSRVL
jgi:hypothetical protein